MPNNPFTRKCVTCGKKEHKSKLLKISLPSISFDLYQNMQGRSFYVCVNKTCLQKSFKKRLVSKYIGQDNTDYKLLNLVKDIDLKVYNLINDIYTNSTISISELFNLDYKPALILVYSKEIEESLQEKGYTTLNIGHIFCDNTLDSKVSIVRSHKLSDMLLNLKNIVENLEIK